MFDDLSGLFYENVLPPFDAYVAARDRNLSGRNTLLRHAMQTASSLFHFREHLPLGWGQTRALVTDMCPDYRLIGDVCNSTKHKTLTRQTQAGTPLVLHATDISEEIIVTRYTDTQGEYSDARVRVVVNCTDGVTRQIDPAIVAVLNFWIRLLRERSGLEYSERSAAKLPGSELVSRTDAQTVNFEVLNTVRWNTRMRLQRYNALTCRSDSIDLTGANIEFNVYEPPECSLIITCNVPNRAEPISATLTL